MGEIRTALIRKFGPLPAWAWAIILGGALYLYRRNAALKAGTSPTMVSDVAPSQTPDSTPQDPVTLQPGESVYDPNTGQLTSTSPEQQPSMDPNDPTGWGTGDRTPVTLDPGQNVYDPATGLLHTPGENAQTPPQTKHTTTKKHKKTKKRITKRTKKPKTQHRQTHNKVKHPTTHKSKPRGPGILRKALHSTRHKSATHKRKPRAKAASIQGARVRERATTPVQPAMRQRPAAPHVVDHAAQRTAPHPSREPVHQTPAPTRRKKRRR